MVLDSFYRNGKANIWRWACSKEEHKDQGILHDYKIRLKEMAVSPETFRSNV